MFGNPRFITCGVQSRIPTPIQALLWYLIETMEGEKDYLQVFHLEPNGTDQHIVHKQEQPPYHKEYDITVSGDIALTTATLFAIDDETHSTLLMADEY